MRSNFHVYFSLPSCPIVLWNFSSLLRHIMSIFVHDCLSVFKVVVVFEIWKLTTGYWTKLHEVNHKYKCVGKESPFLELFMEAKRVQSFDPRDRPTVTAGSDHCFCTCRSSVRRVLLFKKIFQVKTVLVPAVLWVWPSGSLMTPVLFILFLFCFKHMNRLAKLNSNLAWGVIFFIETMRLWDMTLFQLAWKIAENNEIKNFLL